MKLTGKVFAICGVIIELILIISVIYSISMICNTFSSAAESGTTELSAMAPQLSATLYPMRITLSLSLLGDIFLLLALFKYKYKPTWFIRVMWIISFIWLIRVPVGTVLGIVTIRHLIINRNKKPNHH